MALCEISYISEYQTDEQNASFQCFDFLADYKVPKETDQVSNEPNEKYYGKMTTHRLNKLNISSPFELVSFLNEEVWLKVQRLKMQKKKNIFL